MTISFRSRRRRLLAGALTGLVWGTPMGYLYAMARSPLVQGVHDLAGEVRINGHRVTRGGMVEPGDHVETGAGSRAVYVVGRSVFLQREDSRVEIVASDSDAGSPDGSGDGVVEGLRILAGKLLSVHARGKLLVQTRHASIGIRGTGLYVDSQDSRTYVCVCYGTADLSTAEGEPLETVRTRHHESPRMLYPAFAPVRIEVATVVDHTDDKLILLESLAGRSPPFLTDDGGGY